MKELNKQDELINFKIEVDDEKLQDTVDILKEVNDSKPNITIRDNVNVYVTINNFNEPEKEYLEEKRYDNRTERTISKNS